MSDLNILLSVINKLNISKVDLANYLEVSRQMVYNYLSMDSFDDWPIKKRIKILELFEVNNYEELKNLEADTTMLNIIHGKLKDENSIEIFEVYNNLDSNSQQMINDVIRLCEENETKEYIGIFLSLVEHSMISNDYYYLLQYLAKNFNRISPDEFKHNPDTQKAFEGILYSAFNLFNSNKYSKDKTARVHEQFVKELEKKHSIDSQLSNTINITKMLAKNELGIDSIDDSNIDEVLKKIIEIHGRKL
ncbi:MAG: hypothetical protein ACK5K7_05935 [Bacilli bacterium]